MDSSCDSQVVNATYNFFKNVADIILLNKFKI